MAGGIPDLLRRHSHSEPALGRGFLRLPHCGPLWLSVRVIIGRQGRSGADLADAEDLTWTSIDPGDDAAVQGRPLRGGYP